MITYIDSENKLQFTAYQDLFKKASQDLALEEKDYIDSLESYFGHIERLKNLDRKYTILPLQEEYFEIDANARTISVPKNFKNHGLSVQGDHTAETVYFKINRYYDAIDLNNTEIWIQWQTEKNHGIVNEYVRDIETFDDFMIFGWTIGSNMTKDVGNITFSVRFVMADRDDKGNIIEIRYSLSTKTATAIINPTINPEPLGSTFVIDNSANEALLTNFRNTTTSTDNEIRVFVFTRDLDALDSDGDITGTVAVSDLQEDTENIGNYKLDIVAQAYAQPGTVSYNLYRQAGSQPNQSQDKKFPMDTPYVPTEDDIIQVYKDYYTYNAEKNTYEPAGYLSDKELTAEEKANTYERIGVCTLNSNEIENITGVYYVAATATLSNGRASSPKYSTYSLEIPKPEKAVINTGKVTQHFVGEILKPVSIDIADNNVDTYQWKNNYGVLSGETGETIIPDREGYYTLEVTTTRNTDSVIASNKDNPFVVTERASAPNIIEPATNVEITGNSPELKVIAEHTQGVDCLVQPVVSYQWYTASYDLNGKNQADEAILGATAATYKPATNGLYLCRVTVTYNEDTQYKDSPMFKVTKK